MKILLIVVSFIVLDIVLLLIIQIYKKLKINNTIAYNQHMKEHMAYILDINIGNTLRSESIRTPNKMEYYEVVNLIYGIIIKQINSETMTWIKYTYGLDSELFLKSLIDSGISEYNDRILNSKIANTFFKLGPLGNIPDLGE